MARTELNAKLEQIRAVRREVLDLLQDAPDADAALATPELRLWRNLGIVLLRFGDHMREHGNQIAGARQATGVGLSDVQRKLAEAEKAWGDLLGAVVGLTDADLDRVPDEGAWTVRETLDHILAAEENYLAGVRAGYAQRAAEPNAR